MSLDPKTVYIAQRTSDGTAWEERYISGSNLILVTDETGSLIGATVLPPGISVYSASYAETASYAMNGGGISQSLDGFVVTASEALTNETSSYAIHASQSFYSVSASLTISASYSVQSSNSGTASYALTASVASMSLYSNTASYALNAATVDTSSLVVTASGANTNETASYAINSETASYYNILVVDGGSF